MEVSGQLSDGPEEGTRYQLGRRMSGPQSRSGWDGKEKNISAPAGNRTSVFQLVARTKLVTSLIDFTMTCHLLRRCW
jgi:hypothetical protein